MEDAVTAITKYLVIKKLAGDTLTILAIKEYLIDGLSPSTIGYKYKISKFRVRGYIQRIVDKARSHAAATAVVKAVLPYVLGIDPIILRIGNTYICLLCDTHLKSENVEHHIRRRHRDVVNSIVEQIVLKVRRHSQV